MDEIFGKSQKTLSSRNFWKNFRRKFTKKGSGMGPFLPKASGAINTSVTPRVFLDIPVGVCTV